MLMRKGCEQVHKHYQFQLSQTVLQFLIVIGIAIGVGGIIGICVALLTQRLNFPEVEQLLTIVTAYSTYILVEELGGSGVIGVVTAGLVIGNFSTFPKVELLKRSSMIEFWEFITFFINSIVFLLLGNQILLPDLIDNFQTTLIALVAVVVSRAVSIYGFSAVSGWITKRPISLQEQTVLWWVGLRGGVSIALALSIPLPLLIREQIISNSFGVVLFTLLVQGLTTKPLLERLNLLGDRSLYHKYLELVARQNALQQVLAHLIQMENELLIEDDLYQKQTEFVKQQLQQFQQDVKFMKTQYPQLQVFNLQQHQQELLTIENRVYMKFVQEGLLKNPLPSIVQKAFDIE